MAWAAYGLITWGLKELGVAWENYKTLSDTALWTAVGVSAIGIIYGVLVGVGITAAIPGAGWIAAAVVIIVTAIVMAFTYQDFSVEIYIPLLIK